MITAKLNEAERKVLLRAIDAADRSWEQTARNLRVVATNWPGDAPTNKRKAAAIERRRKKLFMVGQKLRNSDG